MVVPAGTEITVDVFEENPPRNLPLRVHSARWSTSCRFTLKRWS